MSLVTAWLILAAIPSLTAATGHPFGVDVTSSSQASRRALRWESAAAVDHTGAGIGT